MSKTIKAGGTETKDIKIQEIQERTDFPNYADEKEIVEAVTAVVSEYIETQEALLAPYHDDLKYFDYMYRCGRNDTEEAKNRPVAIVEDAKSNVGSTMFFKEVQQGAAKAYSFQHGRDRFFKYQTIGTPGVEYSYDDGEMKAKQLTTLAHWNLRSDKFDSRVLMPLNMMVKKDGLCFVAANWVHEKGIERIEILGEAGENGEREKGTTIEEELVLKNQMSYSVLNSRNVRLDPTIDTIEDQQCFSVLKTIQLSYAAGMVRQGYWSEEQFKKLTEDNRWDGTAGADGAINAAENMGEDRLANAETSRLLLWQTWVMLPISDDGDLDEKTVIPQRFVCDFVGNDIESSVCMRIERNDTPKDKIPVGVVHDYADDPGRFFRISRGHVLKSAYAIETTLVNQTMDGGSLALNPPTIEVKDSIVSRPSKWWRGGRFVMKKRIEDIKEFPIVDRSGTAMNLLAYNKSDYESAVDPEKTEGLGARASATEARDVHQLSLAQSAAGVKFVTNQLFDFIGETMRDGWEAYSDPEQVIRITDTDAPIEEIRPHTIDGEFDISVDIVDKIVGDIMDENKLSQDLALFTQNEALAAMVDIQALLEEYFIVRYKKSFAKNQTDFDSVSRAQHENMLMRVNKEVVPIEPEQNHKTHLDEHRAERIRYRGLEGSEEWKKTIELLDIHIEKHEAQLGGNAQGGGSPANNDTVAPQGGAGSIPASATIAGGQSPNAGQAAQIAAGQ